ncbi:hypothetical protein BC938DRAFT_482502 [Jimgerdemannia flammicorona]|uniref:C2H2-type domain-containing protein n=1 Tax=Jimgerdemannia flammicorona TaxID=994334 RepID=A0A433QDV6_9FUNG|nr:hypothetical protein BC938DRAFT_482502 [Jimgerdemannia flammicorona]
MSLRVTPAKVASITTLTSHFYTCLQHFQTHALCEKVVQLQQAPPSSLPRPIPHFPTPTASLTSKSGGITPLSPRLARTPLHETIRNGMLSPRPTPSVSRSSDITDNRPPFRHIIHADKLSQLRSLTFQADLASPTTFGTSPASSGSAPESSKRKCRSSNMRNSPSRTVADEQWLVDEQWEEPQPQRKKRNAREDLYELDADDEAGDRIEMGANDEAGDRIKTGANDEAGDRIEADANNEAGDRIKTGANDEAGDRIETDANDEAGDRIKADANGEAGDRIETGAIQLDCEGAEAEEMEAKVAVAIEVQGSLCASEMVVGEPDEKVATMPREEDDQALQTFGEDVKGGDDTIRELTAQLAASEQLQRELASQLEVSSSQHTQELARVRELKEERDVAVSRYEEMVSSERDMQSRADELSERIRILEKMAPSEQIAQRKADELLEQNRILKEARDMAVNQYEKLTSSERIAQRRVDELSEQNQALEFSAQEKEETIRQLRQDIFDARRTILQHSEAETRECTLRSWIENDNAIIENYKGQIAALQTEVENQTDLVANLEKEKRMWKALVTQIRSEALQKGSVESLSKSLEEVRSKMVQQKHEATAMQDRLSATVTRLETDLHKATEEHSSSRLASETKIATLELEYKDFRIMALSDLQKYKEKYKERTGFLKQALGAKNHKIKDFELSAKDLMGKFFSDLSKLRGDLEVIAMGHEGTKSATELTDKSEGAKAENAHVLQRAEVSKDTETMEDVRDEESGPSQLKLSQTDSSEQDCPRNQCQACDLVLPQSELEEHQAQCPRRRLLGRSTRSGHFTAAKIQKHTVKSQPKRLLCTHCNGEFASSTTLSRHVKVKHTKEIGPFPCQHCIEVFAWPAGLSSHVKSKHPKQVHDSRRSC